MKRVEIRYIAVIVVILLSIPALASAQTDEIQVYDGGLAAVGTFNLTLHNNFTPRGLTTPAFPGAVIADKSFNGVPEWALGVTPWFEAGLYLPLYSRDKETGWGLDGFKLRALFAVPNADDRTFFYGANFEFSFNAKRWDTKALHVRDSSDRRLASEADRHHHQPDCRHGVRWPRKSRVRAGGARRVQLQVRMGGGGGRIRRLRSAPRISPGLRSRRTSLRRSSTAPGRHGTSRPAWASA